MKCLRCGPLIKAIDAYLAKAENDLYEQLTMEGYLKAKESLNTVDEIEEVVTKLLEDNADDLLKELADAIDLETFFKDNWPKFKNKSKLAQDLFDVFHTQFSTIMPTYVEAYVQKTDAELTVTKLTKRTTDWISSWSSDLADIMKLDTETEIEAVLKKGLNDGKGINDVANLIADSGIRSPGYRARRVALTEVLRAHGYAQLESYIQSPAVEEKMWKHTGAYRNDPRQNHVDMDGVHVPKGQPFTLIGADGNTYYPMTPRDVCLPPRESVNCHCLLQPVVSEEVLGLWQGVLGSAIVTGAELVTGMILNVWLGLGVWDYSGMPLNYKGQICLPFSILWIFVSIAAVVLDDWLRYWLFGEERPHYTLFRRGESR